VRGVVGVRVFAEVEFRLLKNVLFELTESPNGTGCLEGLHTIR
jgi:hypothetical protein